MRHVREAGGIPLVKTNVPQGLENSECSNPLWGVTKNPYNVRYTPGGSSGGEGALLAMGGLGGGLISEGVSGSHRVSVGSTVSNRVLAGSACQEQWIENFRVINTPRFVHSVRRS